MLFLRRVPGAERKRHKKIRENIDLWKRELKTELTSYLLKPFPEIVSASDEIAKRYIRGSVLEKAIFRDLSTLFEIKDIELIEKLTCILASNPGMIVNFEDLSKDLGRSKPTITRYLHYLKSCFILKDLRNFRGSCRVSSRKLKKYYLTHPCLALAIANPEQGKIAESSVQFVTRAESYWRKGSKEVDFVTVKDGEIKPVEVKYSAKVRIKEVKGLLKFMEAFEVKEGLVITEDYEAEEKQEYKTIKFVPMWKWIL